jgi:hypothetical protein
MSTTETDQQRRDRENKARGNLGNQSNQGNRTGNDNNDQNNPRSGSSSGQQYSGNTGNATMGDNKRNTGGMGKDMGSNNRDMPDTPHVTTPVSGHKQDADEDEETEQ